MALISGMQIQEKGPILNYDRNVMFVGNILRCVVEG